MCQGEVESSIQMSDRATNRSLSGFRDLALQAFFLSISSACQLNDEKACPMSADNNSPLGESGYYLPRQRRPWRDEATCKLFAKTVPFRHDALPPQVSALFVGDGWGCAKLHDDAFYCWKAPGLERSVARFVRAHHISRFEGSWSVAAGPDRACVAAPDEQSARCWRAPGFIEQLGNLTRSDNFAEANSWQLSFTDKGMFDRTPVLHGAVYGGRGGLFWGNTVPIDASNTAISICREWPITVPCAIADQRVLKSFSPQGVVAGNNSGDVIIGDLFACKADTQSGIWCVGANRDGFFGTREDCPSYLLTAWPTSKGPVLAPNAKCARIATRIGVGQYHGEFGSAGPRGLCLSHVVDNWNTERVCLGAIELPRMQMARVVVGLGDEPSACGTSESGSLYCWGAGYSTNATTEDPVRIDFTLPAEGVAFDESGTFHSSCGIHRNCAREVRSLPDCRSTQPSLSLAEVVGLAEGFAAQQVTVRGALVLSPVKSNFASISCAPFRAGESGKPKPIIGKGGGYDAFCCPARGNAPISVTDGTESLYIDGSFCGGDTSRTCCSIPVLGQQVLVTGILNYREPRVGVPEGLSLAEATICQLRSRANR